MFLTDCHTVCQVGVSLWGSTDLVREGVFSLMEQEWDPSRQLARLQQSPWPTLSEAPLTNC